MKKSFMILIVLFASLLQAEHTFNIVEEKVRIPMRDGVKLAATLYRPAQEGKFPAIVFRTPYGTHQESLELPWKAAKSGYLVFLVDVRGRYESEGEFIAYQNEKQDGYDTIEWIAQSPHCNGKVGTWGRSYRGYAQWLALSQGPPSLKAAVPEMTPIHSHQFFYVGGAFSYSWLDWFMLNIFPNLRQRANDHSGPWDDAIAEKEWQSEKKNAYLHRPLGDHPELQKYAPYYFEWLKHQTKSDYWNFANVDHDFNKMKTPVLLISGWYDSAYGPLGAMEGFQRMRTEGGSVEAREQSRLILGPYHHGSINVQKTKLGILDNGPSAGMDYDAVLLHWFDQHMKGGSPFLPPVSLFVLGANQWREENEWPLSRAVPTSYYLHANSELKPDLPLRHPPDQYVFDPNNPLWDPTYEQSNPFDQRDIELRKDVLVFTSAPMENDLEVTGQIIADLFVSSTAKDTDFAITFCDVAPDGTSVNLSSLDAGFLRMRFRNGFEKEELMEPGKIYNIRIDNLYTSNLFKKGHRIRLQVTSSKMPHYDPNPNTGTDFSTETNLITATQSIYHDNKHPSRLVLPVVK